MVIKFNESFTIDTTAGKAEKDSVSNTKYKLSFRNYSFEIIGKKTKPKSNYTVAHLVFEGNIIFEEGSHVVLTGAHALSIKSVTGDITVNTTINVTCTAAGANETCLGGYTVSETSVQNKIYLQSIYRGMYALSSLCATFYFVRVFISFFIISHIVPSYVA